VAKYNITNADAVVGRFHKWARILKLNERTNRATVEILGEGHIPTGEVLDGVAFHYHCTPTSIEVRGSSENAALAFNVGDVVILRYDEEVPRIVARKFGIAEFGDPDPSQDYYSQMELDRSGAATKCEKPIFITGCQRFVSYDICTGELKEMEGGKELLPPLLLHAATMYKGLMYIFGGYTYYHNIPTFSFVYDPQIDTGNLFMNWDGAVHSHTTVVWRDSLYLLGGAETTIKWVLAEPHGEPYLRRLKMDNEATEGLISPKHWFEGNFQYDYIIVPKTLTAKFVESDQPRILWDTGEHPRSKFLYYDPERGVFYFFVWSDLITNGDIRDGEGIVYCDPNSAPSDYRIRIRHYSPCEPMNAEVKFNYASWEVGTPNAPCGLAGHAAVVIGDEMYVYGGHHRNTAMNYPPYNVSSLLKFNFLTNTWTQLQDCPYHQHLTHRYECWYPVGVTDGERLYIYGGYIGQNEDNKPIVSNKLVMYDGTWHLISYGPRGLMGAAGVLYNKKIYIFGGLYYKEGALSPGTELPCLWYSRMMYIYDLETGSWQSYDFPYDMQFCAAAVRPEEC